MAKLIALTSAPLITIACLPGLNAYPVWLGVIPYVPSVKPPNAKLPLASAVTVVLDAPDKLTVAFGPPAPEIVPVMA